MWQKKNQGSLDEESELIKIELDDETLPPNSFKIAICTPKNTPIDKLIYIQSNTGKIFKIKAGKNTGSDLHEGVKFDSRIIDFTDFDSAQFFYFKEIPGENGANDRLCNIRTRVVEKSNLRLLDHKGIIIYWNDENDDYFSNDSNRIDPRILLN
ncbi:hypothetical protein CYY_000011 [Polysphondylium violaceum]|uniref:Uncharacterized protein n=1 Tax=Polysphondylium violaceum TaxID=133409 RepID=A0A8J4Q4H1_9MYCE|nr:hypothetical protein CYY_000011 [Polysphondylium violaceum]